MREPDSPPETAFAEPSVLSAAEIRRWYESAADALARHRRDIDLLNVFPVPDGDTGTNLAATLRAARAAAAEAPADTSPAELTARAAKAALLGARGNSGVIMAQLLTGLAEVWTGDEITVADLADGLRRAADTAADAVAEPVPGTMLTVLDAAARSADRNRTTRLADCCRAVSADTAEAVTATVGQLTALTRAGVVDAGAVGVALLCDCLLEVVTGKPTTAAMDAAAVRTGSRPATEVARESGSPEFGYEVQYLLDAGAEAVAGLRARLSSLGDSLVIVGAAAPSGTEVPTWNVHVHVNDVGAAVEAGIATGHLYRLAVTRFSDQGTDSPGADEQSTVDRGVVVLTDGVGLGALVSAEGARPVVAAEPSGADVAAVMRDTGAREVIVLADGDRCRAAESAAESVRRDGVRVAVIPTRAPVQALAALAVRQPSRRFDDDVIAMAEAAGACRPAEVRVATEPGLTSVGRCEAGDYLGLADGDVIVLGTDLGEILTSLVDRLCAAGAELLTIVSGADLPDRRMRAVQSHLAGQWPMVEVQSVAGGQADRLVWIGAE